MENNDKSCIICFGEKKVIHAQCKVCTGITIHRKCLDQIIFNYKGKCPKCRGELLKNSKVIGKNIIFSNFAIRIQINRGIYLHNIGGPRYFFIRKLLLFFFSMFFLWLNFNFLLVCYDFLVEMKDLALYKIDPKPNEKLLKYNLYSWLISVCIFILY